MTDLQHLLAHFSFSDPALTVALALAVGTLVQGIAHHLRVPGIVFLLAAGVVLGPEGAGVVLPASLGTGLDMLVGFAVAVILFEGALHLDLRRLRREAHSIRGLVTSGALVTAVGGTLAPRLLLDWSWRTSLVFGTLVIVTGPTVVTPLLRRIRVRRNIATVLEAEGVLGDAVGAVAAAVAFEIAIDSGAGGFGVDAFVVRLAVGALVGGAVGGVASGLLKLRGWVPEGLRNIFTLTLALACFQISNSLVHESGIVAVVVAGLVLGNLRVHDVDELREFKEQLTTMFIGMLFVLLAADVGLADVRGLGWPGVAVVGVLMFVVRPLDVVVATRRSSLELKEKAFLAWLAPRGIVAAAVSTLFAESLESEGLEGGGELQALVFLVIAVTVVVQGLSGGVVASALGVREAPRGGYAVLGANAVGRALARELSVDTAGSILIDSNATECGRAEEEGLSVVYGSALQESVLVRAGLDHRAGCVGFTTNVGINFTFARRAAREFRSSAVWVALERNEVAVGAGMVERIGGRVLFGGPVRLVSWIRALERGTAVRCVLLPPPESKSTRLDAVLPPTDEVLPLARLRSGAATPVDGATRLGPEDRLACSVRREALAAVAAAVAERGWRLEQAGEPS
ncbi:MAG: cation:proton antiporter [Acidobacteriota bacterium]|nr:cation:proton antiporter [Acidobacteriota bacterium]